MSETTLKLLELIKDLEKFYPKEEQKKYGVIGIKIELINKQK